MNSEYIPILTTLISVAGSLLVAYGTWTVQMKQARQKEHDEIVRLLEEHKNDTELQIKLIQKDIQFLLIHKQEKQLQNMMVHIIQILKLEQRSEKKPM